MASSSSFILLLGFCLLFIGCRSAVQVQAEDMSFQLTTQALEWPSTMPFYDEFGEDDDVDGGTSRRSLFWRTTHYYISYGALSANRIPCPPRSGRSYYTHNCYKARGPVHPYTRGCSKITRCRR
uniref:Protein RALF-like 34 n=1 Tax=Nelumbo nucifera TaxID=4432 RepID=A0A822Z9J8_NELNU|nr:TPA_asm: hypothetical protein HUJ06_015583 [Nelumbo nucifera]